MSIRRGVPLLGFCAFSGTGNTRLLTQLIPLPRAEGLRLGVIKHAHHGFDINQPGKDSCRPRESGAEQMLIASRHRMAFVRQCTGPEREPRLAGLLHCIATPALDLVLVEGFKREPIAKIELHRPSLGKPLIHAADRRVIAIATDAPLTPVRELPVLDLNRREAILDFVLGWIGSFGAIAQVG